MGPQITGTQHATEEELKMFQNSNGGDNIARIKSLGCLVADVAI